MVFDHVSEIVCVVAYGAMDPKPTSRLDVVRNKMVTRKIAEATLHDSLEFASYARPIVAFCWIRLVHGVPLTSYVCLLVSLSLFLSICFSLSLVPPLFSVLLFLSLSLSLSPSVSLCLSLSLSLSLSLLNLQSYLLS